MSDVSTPAIPQGSVVDSTRPRSPTSIGNFHCDTADNTEIVLDDFADVFADLANDLVVPMESISDAYCHKAGMSIGDVAATMDWQLFANCARDKEFGLADSLSEEEDSQDGEEANE